MRGEVRRKLSKNRKGRSPYLQDPQAHTAQKRSFSASQTSLQLHQRVVSGLNNLCGHCGYRKLTRPISRMFLRYQRRRRHPDHPRGFRARPLLRLTHNRIRYAPNPRTSPSPPLCPFSPQLRFLLPRARHLQRRCLFFLLLDLVLLRRWIGSWQ